MSPAQHQVLATLAPRPMSAKGIARGCGSRVQDVQHTLDALFRRSLVTIDERSRWTLTDRGRKASA